MIPNLFNSLFQQRYYKTAFPWLLWLAIFLCLFSMIGCRDNQNLSSNQLKNAGQATQTNAALILGSDANNNGVRDDIDTLISNFHTDPVMLKAYTQYAKGIQQSFLVDSPEAAKKWIDIDTRNLYCFIEIERQVLATDPEAMIPIPYVKLEEIRSETYNTGPRLLKKAQFDMLSKNITNTFDVNANTHNSCD